MSGGTGTILRKVTGFHRYLGIDYSGAGTPIQGLPGLRVFVATRDHGPREVTLPSGTRSHWTRNSLAQWLAVTLRHGPRTLVGVDHGFSFPLRYFETHQIPTEWPEFLDDFQHHWPTDRDGVSVDQVRNGTVGHGHARSGNARWRRRTEERCGAKSVFHFDVPGSVAKSTHAGLPWLRFLRGELGSQLHCWPFDGWQPGPGRSVLAESYPALWSQVYAIQGRNPHQHDAYTIARWFREQDLAGTLATAFHPKLDATERSIAAIEGWILGIPGEGGRVRHVLGRGGGPDRDSRTAAVPPPRASSPPAR